MFVRTLLRCTKRTHSRRLMSVHGVADVNDAPVQISILGNGIKVATQETHSPLVSSTLFIEAGPRYETACCNGITHFIEHLAYKGFDSMDKCHIEECALHAGIRFTAKTTQEYQYFQAACLQDAAPKALEILCKIISQLRPDDCEIEAERENLYLELCDADRDMKALTFENLIKTAFQGTPLGQPVIGPSQNLAAYDAEFVRNFMCQHYQPWRLTFATSGNVKHEEMVSVVCKSLNYVQPTCCTPDYGATRYTGSSMIYRDDSQPFAHVCLAVEVGGYNSPEYMIWMNMKHMIGSWSKSTAVFGTWPELAKRCAHTALCDSYETFYLAFRDVGLWGTYFRASAMEVSDMVESLQNIWMNACTTTVFADVERARRTAALEGSRKRSGSIQSSRTIGMDVMYRGRYRSFEEYRDVLYDMKVETVVDVVEPRLYDRCPVVSAVGPTEGVPDYTRIRSGMYWLRL